MSDHPENPARPVSLFTIVILMALFAAFLFLVRRYYTPTATAAHNAAAEKVTKEMDWRATAAARRATLHETQQEQAKLATTYGWVDQKGGVVRLPIERAMQLVVQEQEPRQQVRQIRDLPPTPRSRP